MHFPVRGFGGWERGRLWSQTDIDFNSVPILHFTTCKRLKLDI